jgi:spore maturation protein CgeB
VKFAVFGVSLTSSWGNGQATTYRSLLRELVRRGHDVLFLERDRPWFKKDRDLSPTSAYGRIGLYESLAELRDRYLDPVRSADVVMLGSSVPEGAFIADWIFKVARGLTAFYDTDTPVTLEQLLRSDTLHIARRHVSRFDLYLSVSVGPTLERLEREFGARRARPLFGSVDPEVHAPLPASAPIWDLGYLGTYAAGRQVALDRLLLAPARNWSAGSFVAAGAHYPDTIAWPTNVARRPHVPPAGHAAYFGGQRYTLNLTRRAMADAGWSPSVRLFEAAACGTPVISDYWPGLFELFEPGEEILIARTSKDVLRYLFELPEDERRRIGARARARVLAAHTARHRASELEGYLREARAEPARARLV